MPPGHRWKAKIMDKDMLYFIFVMSQISLILLGIYLTIELKSLNILLTTVSFTLLVALYLDSEHELPWDEITSEQYKYIAINQNSPKIKKLTIEAMENGEVSYLENIGIYFAIRKSKDQNEQNLDALKAKAVKIRLPR